MDPVSVEFESDLYGEKKLYITVEKLGTIKFSSVGNSTVSYALRLVQDEEFKYMGNLVSVEHENGLYSFKYEISKDDFRFINTKLFGGVKLQLRLNEEQVRKLKRLPIEFKEVKVGYVDVDESKKLRL